MIKCLSLLLVFIVTVAHSNAMQTEEYDASYYATTRVGDTIAIPEDDTTDFFLFVFASSSSCFTCKESIRPIQSLVSRVGKTTVTMFIHSNDKALPSRLQEEHKWDFDIVLDPLGAYQRLFGVTNIPLGIVADRAGVVQAIGPIGTSTYDWNAVIKKVHRPSQMKRPAHPIKEIELDSSETFVAGGLQRQIVFLNDSLFAVHSIGLRRTAVYSTSGKRRAFRTRLDDSEYTPLIPMLARAPINAAGCLIVDEDVRSGERVFVRLDTMLRTVKVEHPTFVMRDGAAPMFFFSTDRSLQQFAAAVTFSDSASRGSNNVSSSVWDIASGSMVQEFPIAEHFLRADLSNFYWTSVIVSDSEIASVSNLDDVLHIARPPLRSKIVDIPIAFDPSSWRTKWRSTYTELTWNTPLETRKKFGEFASCLDQLQRDDVRGDYYVSYYNNIPMGGIASYLVGPIGSSSCHTMDLGRDVLSHRVSNGILYCSVIRDGKLRLLLYRLSND